MIAKEKSNLESFNAKAAFEVKHSGELPLGIIPAGRIGRGNDSIWLAGETKSGASKFKIFLGVQQIGILYQITPDRFSAVLSYEYGGNTSEFKDPKLAADWLVDRYFEWLDGDIEISAVKFGYEICHNKTYIGFVSYSELYEEWVATSYPDRCSCFSLAKHHGEFADAVKFILNEYLNPHSVLELEKLTT